MYKALVACRAGVGSSLMLKIKANEVINENNLPIELEHASLDAVPGFNGEFILTLVDVAEELQEAGNTKILVGIRNVVDKNEIKEKLEEALAKVQK